MKITKDDLVWFLDKYQPIVISVILTLGIVISVYIYTQNTGFNACTKAMEESFDNTYPESCVGA